MKLFSRTDVAELVVGANVLAFPIAATEEIWNLSEELGTLPVLGFAVLSCVFLSVFIYYIHYAKSGEGTLQKFRFDGVRLVATYGVTLLVCASILALLGKFPLFTDTAVALKRMVLVAFPASFSATVVDSLR